MMKIWRLIVMIETCIPIYPVTSVSMLSTRSEIKPRATAAFGSTILVKAMDENIWGRRNCSSLSYYTMYLRRVRQDWLTGSGRTDWVRQDWLGQTWLTGSGRTDWLDQAGLTGSGRTDWVRQDWLGQTGLTGSGRTDWVRQDWLGQARLTGSGRTG